MTDGALADLIGSWFGTGPERGLSLIFVVTAFVGLAVTLVALRSRPYHRLSSRYMSMPDPPAGSAPEARPEAHVEAQRAAS